MREVALAEGVVAEDAVGLEDDDRDLGELGGELAGQLGREAVGGVVAPRRLEGALDLEGGRVAADAEDLEVVALADVRVLGEDALAIDRGVGGAARPGGG